MKYHNKQIHIYPEEIKNSVRALRFVNGLSLGQIRKVTGIPRTTIRGWISDTPLTPEQKEKIKQESLRLLQEGRIQAQKVQKEKREVKEKELFLKGINDIGSLNIRDMFVAGVALYWAEGFKNRHEHRLGFCNSDPTMIRFYIYWLKRCLSAENKNLIARLTLNKSYEKKTKEIEGYWSRITGIPLEQFTKPFYQNSVWKKQFNTENYFGVLRIHVKESLGPLLKMRGWIEGLKSNVK